MSGPWEDYAAPAEPAAAAPPAAGPWGDYASPQAATAKPKITAEQHSMLEELGRQIGLTVRAGASGVAAVPAMLSDAVTGPINAGLDAALGEGHGFRFQRAEAALGDLMTRAGVPTPKNAEERVVQDVSSAMAGAGGFVKAGQLAAESASPVVSAVGDTLASGPGLQIGSAASGQGAASITREKGGSGGAQIAAQVAGSLAPGAAIAGAQGAARSMLRGGEEGRQAAQDNIDAFAAAGTTPTLAQATDGRIARAAESLLAKTPGGAGVIAAKAQQQADQMADAVQRVSDGLAPGANATTAGEAIMRGVGAFKSGFKTLQNTLYSKLDQYLPADTPVPVGNTEFALKQLNEDIPGAPNLSQLFKNSRIKGIDQALQADLDQAATAGTLPYEAVKKLRTLVGNEIADSSLIADVPRSKWRPLYGALSDDLGQAAQAAGPDAQQAWQWANQFTKTQLARLDDLSSIVSKDAPEKVFSAAIAGTSEGDTVVRRVVGALPQVERKEVAAAVLQRLGRATPGQQNAMGDAFSSETFLTNLSKMSTQARQTIFGRTGLQGIEDQIANFAQVAESRRDGGKVFANPSGTAGSAAQLANAGAIGSATVLASMGHPLPLAGALAVPATAYGAAKAVTSPGAAQFAATTTTAPAGSAAVATEAASRVDPIAAIGAAKNVDEAISAASSALPPINIPRLPKPAPLAALRRPANAVVQAPNNAPPPPAAAASSPAQAKQVKDAPTGDGQHPFSVWTGRRGAGYLTTGDAQVALPTRERTEPDLRWEIERLPNGRYRLAGYPRE